jgi:beta-phosphoglucomutase-like phosphatase (HAD superfamily)
MISVSACRLRKWQQWSSSAWRPDTPISYRSCQMRLRRSGRWLIETFLDASSLRASFAAVMSTEQVAHGKPAPDIYLAVAEQLGRQPQRCAAVEDSSNGLRSAASAGLQVIAIPHSVYPPDPDALQAARLALTSLAELTESTVVALGQSA